MDTYQAAFEQGKQAFEAGQVATQSPYRDEAQTSLRRTGWIDGFLVAFDAVEDDAQPEA